MNPDQSYEAGPQELAPIANVMAEGILLGCLMTNNQLFDVAIELVTADDFYEPIHNRIFVAIQDAIAHNRLASSVTLRPMFADDEAMHQLGGSSYLAAIEDGAKGAGVLGVKEFAGQIADLARTRALYDRGMECLAAVRDTRAGINPFRHAAALEAIAFEVTATKAERTMLFTTSDAIRRVTANVRHIQTTGEATGAVAADLPEVTKVLGALQKKHLTIIAGRPGMGKSGIACGLARSFAQGDQDEPAETRRQYGTGFVSLEMGDIDLGQRFAADIALSYGEEILHADIRDAKLTARQLNVLDWCAEQVDKIPLKFADVAGITLSRLGMIARRMKRELQAEGSDLEVLFVDYLQLLQGDGKIENKTTEITQISQGLKRLAKELDCSVVALSQLSRAVEQREIKIPQLSDLRESGSIEQDADNVCFVYRDSYYLAQKEPDRSAKPKDWDDWDISMRACENHMDLIVPKRRGGATGRSQLLFLKTFQAVRRRDYFASAGGMFNGA
jgi:replicative DNA helicase